MSVCYLIVAMKHVRFADSAVSRHSRAKQEEDKELRIKSCFAPLIN